MVQGQATRAAADHYDHLMMTFMAQTGANGPSWLAHLSVSLKVLKIFTSDEPDGWEEEEENA